MKAGFMMKSYPPPHRKREKSHKAASRYLLAWTLSLGLLLATAWLIVIFAPTNTMKVVGEVGAISQYGLPDEKGNVTYLVTARIEGTPERQFDFIVQSSLIEPFQRALATRGYVTFSYNDTERKRISTEYKGVVMRTY
jgi:hypothetical protein